MNQIKVTQSTQKKAFSKYANDEKEEAVEANKK